MYGWRYYQNKKRTEKQIRIIKQVVFWIVAISIILLVLGIVGRYDLEIIKAGG